MGVDVAETALTMAREKARDRGIEAEFVPADALRLDRLGRSFDTVLDCGLFHTFDDVDRTKYVASLATVTEPGGTLYVLCFSEGATTPGPRPVSQAELRDSFGLEHGWNVVTIESERLETRFNDHGTPCWLATMHRS